MRTQDVNVVKDLNTIIDFFIEMDKSKYEHIINQNVSGASCGLFKTRDEFANFLKWRSSHPIEGNDTHIHNLYLDLDLGNFKFPACGNNGVNHNVSIFFNWYTGELRLEFDGFRRCNTAAERKCIIMMTGSLWGLKRIDDSNEDWMYDSGEFVWFLSQVSCDNLSIVVRITFKAKPDEK